MHIVSVNNFVVYFCLLILAEQSIGNCPDIISKKKWAGNTASSIEYQIIPLKYVIIHHTVTPTCNSKSSCANIIQNIQNYHMNELGYADIGYNFLVGEDGRVYEGCGWHTVGAHTYGYNRLSIGIGFIGDYSEKLPGLDVLNSVKQFLECAVETGELDEKYKLLGGRQLIASESPGLELYTEIQDWDHWASKP